MKRIPNKVFKTDWIDDFTHDSDSFNQSEKVTLFQFSL